MPWTIFGELKITMVVMILPKIEVTFKIRAIIEIGYNKIMITYK